MDVQIRRNPTLSKVQHIYVLLPEQADISALELPDEIEKEVRELVTRGRFTGRSEEMLSTIDEKGRRLTIAGAGRKEALSRRAMRIAIRSLGKTAQRNRDERIVVAVPLLEGDRVTELRWAADQLAHADYRYASYLGEEERKKRVDVRATLIAPSSMNDRDVKRAEHEANAISSGVRTARELGNTPPNELTPTRMGEIAREMCSELGIKCTVHDLKSIQKLGMGGLLAVNRGSVQEPRFVVMEYTPARARKTVAFVGKGITFDSGGISIKPSERMEEMKFDMCGAAAVIGLMEAAARLELKVRVIGIFASTENLPSGSAYKPGDIIRMMSGKTVEIVNTDAEGRMILADALHYATRFKPDHLVDFATLTGACVIALGGEATGMFTTDDVLAQKLIESGTRTGERVWRLPEWDEYKEAIRSEWADLKNSGGRWAGAITAAVFLKEFAQVDSWAHLDIAGTAYSEQENSRDPRGANGTGVRLAIDFLQSIS